MNWKYVKLSTLCKTGAGGTPLKSKKEYYENGNIPWLRSGEVNNRNIVDCDIKITSKGLKESSAKLFPPRTVLIAMYGATAGQVGILNFECSTNQAVCGILPNENITPEFIYYKFLEGKKALVKQAVGGAQPNISQIKIKNTLIPDIPLPEQKRIVSILDRTFEAIDKAKANAEQNLKNAKELFESYLQGVFENKGDDWTNSTIGKTCNLITGGTPSRSKSEYFKNGTINWLVSGDINKKTINECDGKITELGLGNSNAKFLPLNSVMIALNGQGKTRGTVAILKIKATCNQSLVSIYPKDDNKILPELIFSNLQGRYNEIRKITGDSGNDRRGLNMPLIRKIKFSYPKSIKKQNQIVQKLDSLSTESKKLESIYQQKINDLEELKKSILQQAFAGKLTEKEIAL